MRSLLSCSDIFRYVFSMTSGLTKITHTFHAKSKQHRARTDRTKEFPPVTSAAAPGENQAMMELYGPSLPSLIGVGSFTTKALDLAVVISTFSQ